jgi:hypothetical protein
MNAQNQSFLNTRQARLGTFVLGLVLLWFWLMRWLSWRPIPTAEQSVKCRVPTRLSHFLGWQFSIPHTHRRTPMQVLVGSDVVVVKGKMFDHILQLSRRFDMQFIGEAFECHVPSRYQALHFLLGVFLSRPTRFILENGRVFVVPFENPSQNLSS